MWFMNLNISNNTHNITQGGHPVFRGVNAPLAPLNATMRMHTHVNIYIRTYIYIHIHTHTLIHAHVYKQHIHIYIHIHIVHIHAHVYTQYAHTLALLTTVVGGTAVLALEHMKFLTIVGRTIEHIRRRAHNKYLKLVSHLLEMITLIVTMS